MHVEIAALREQWVASRQHARLNCTRGLQLLLDMLVVQALTDVLKDDLVVLAHALREDRQQVARDSWDRNDLRPKYHVRHLQDPAPALSDHECRYRLAVDDRHFTDALAAFNDHRRRRTIRADAHTEPAAEHDINIMVRLPGREQHLAFGALPDRAACENFHQSGVVDLSEQNKSGNEWLAPALTVAPPVFAPNAVGNHKRKAHLHLLLSALSLAPAFLHNIVHRIVLHVAPTAPFGKSCAI